MGSALPQVAKKIAHGFGNLWSPICMQETCVSPFLPRTMHIMHDLDLHMHAADPLWQRSAYAGLKAARARLINSLSRSPEPCRLNILVAR